MAQTTFITVLGRFADNDPVVKALLNQIVNKAAEGLIFTNSAALAKASEALQRTEPVRQTPTQKESLGLVGLSGARLSAFTSEKRARLVRQSQRILAVDEAEPFF